MVALIFNLTQYLLLTDAEKPVDGQKDEKDEENENLRFARFIKRLCSDDFFLDAPF